MISENIPMSAPDITEEDVQTPWNSTFHRTGGGRCCLIQSTVSGAKHGGTHTRWP